MGAPGGSGAGWIQFNAAMYTCLRYARPLAMSASTLLACACVHTPTTDLKPPPASLPVPGLPNMASYKIGGVSMVPRTVKGTYGGDNSLAISVSDSVAQQSLMIGLLHVTGLGTCSGATITYHAEAGGWYASRETVGSIRVQITAFNLTAREASGIFSATLEPFPGTSATGTQVITDGVFTNVAF